MQHKVEMTVADIEKLVSKIEALHANYGRIIVHGDGNGDAPEEIVRNLKTQTIGSGVYWWAKEYFPELASKAFDPEGELFPDDEEWEETYDSCGF